MLQFKVLKEHNCARLGSMILRHTEIQTPCFMPVGTRACVKTLKPADLLEIDARIILGNTYHLMLRPGLEIIEEAGGLHRFMNWERPILTDSGGYQVFSLSKLNTITEDGVRFRSHIDGSEHFLGPRESMHIQRVLGSDIVMSFDECSPYPCSYERAVKAMERTHRWESICLSEGLKDHQNLFAITQGSIYPDLRQASAKELASQNFAGYAIGGLSVGEGQELMKEMIEHSTPYLPRNKPRYLMGVGTPRDILEAVKRGVDLFDCVMPTRNARNGTAFTWSGKINIKAARYARDFSPLDPELNCSVNAFSKAYIRHLLNCQEITGMALVSMHNLAFYLDFMRQLRHAIQNDQWEQFYERVSRIYPK